MPKYYFILQWADRRHDDPHGTLPPNDGAALSTAERIIRELQEAGGYDEPDLAMVVKAAAGRIVHSVRASRAATGGRGIAGIMARTRAAGRRYRPGRRIMPRLFGRKQSTVPVRSYLILALGTCLGATLGATASFGGEQSLLYPPQVRARPVVVVNGGGYQRHYWDPRYAALCPWTPVAARRLARYQAPHETLCLR